MRSDQRSYLGVAAVVVALLVISAAGCGIFAHHEAPAPTPVPTPSPTATPEAYLLLKLGERRVYLVQNDVKSPPEGYQVAIGQPKWPTPTGHFQVNEMIELPDFLAFDFNNPKKGDRGRVPPGPNNPLGLRWIGFATAHGWQVGFHGTAKTSVLGQAVSHGCVRMSNPDVVQLFSRVKIGTEVVVEE